MTHLRAHLSTVVVAGVTAIACSAGGAVAGAMITGAQIKDGTVTGADVKNHSLVKADLNAATVAALRGARGRTGPAGPAGASGTTGATLVTGTAVPVPAGSAELAEVTCPSGTKVIGTGVRNVGSAGGIQTTVYISHIDISDDQTSVTVAGRYDSSGADVATIAAQAICAA